MNGLRTLLCSCLVLYSVSVYAQDITFIEKYTYTAGEADSKLTCRTISLIQTKRLLIEKIGTFVKASTEIKNFRLTKDEIITLTAGVVKTEIIEEEWDGTFYTLTAKIETDPDEVAKQINKYKDNKESEDEIKELENVNEKYLQKISELKEELSVIQNNLVILNKSYEDTSAIVTSWESFERGLELSRKGAFDEALREFSKAIRINPKYNHYYHRGKVYAKLKQFEEAIADFDRTLELNPNVKDAYFHRGKAYRRMGQKRKGLMDIKEAAKRGSGNGKRWLKLKGIM